ncbi:MAG: peptide chain release factor N(5)-glutamine methyltransferase, partial [Moraxellaceae bacterium]
MHSLTIANCLKQFSQLSHVSDSPRLDIEIFLTYILKKDRTYLFTWPEKELSEEQTNQFNDFFARRLTGEPVAHIIGQREFWSLPLLVNNSTLIPRPDTELLVEAALGLFSEDKEGESRRLLDLGTGTGAVVLALAHEKKSWQCVAIDKTPAAVDLAEKNRALLNLDNVDIHQSDWFGALADQAPFDIIVSNPPYIDPNDEHLAQGDVRFEPLSAL